MPPDSFIEVVSGRGERARGEPGVPAVLLVFNCAQPGEDLQVCGESKPNHRLPSFLAYCRSPAVLLADARSFFTLVPLTQLEAWLSVPERSSAGDAGDEVLAAAREGEAATDETEAHTRVEEAEGPQQTAADSGVPAESSDARSANAQDALAAPEEVSDTGQGPPAGAPLSEPSLLFTHLPPSPPRPAPAYGGPSGSPARPLGRPSATGSWSFPLAEGSAVSAAGFGGAGGAISPVPEGTIGLAESGGAEPEVDGSGIGNDDVGGGGGGDHQSGRTEQTESSPRSSSVRTPSPEPPTERVGIMELTLRTLPAVWLVRLRTSPESPCLYHRRYLRGLTHACNRMLASSPRPAPDPAPASRRRCAQCSRSFQWEPHSLRSGGRSWTRASPPKTLASQALRQRTGRLLRWRTGTRTWGLVSTFIACCGRNRFPAGSVPRLEFLRRGPLVMPLPQVRDVPAPPVGARRVRVQCRHRIFAADSPGAASFSCFSPSGTAVREFPSIPNAR